MISEPVLCNYCKVDDATVVFGPGVAQINQIVRCNRCGLMYSNPRTKAPDHVNLSRADPNFNPLTPGNWRILKEKIQVRDYDRTRKLLNNLRPERGKLLEVGCGLGYLLAAFRDDGWDVLGVEPYYQACRYAGAELGIEVKNAILETAEFPDESFDVVLLNHVIEHIEDPLGTLREVNRVLKPGGHFVIETPRYDTLSFKLLGRRERSINCGGHIYFFTTQTLKNLYEAAGFEQVDLRYTGRSLTMERMLWNVGVVSKSKTVQKALEVLSRKLGLSNVRLYVNFRDVQRACVKKVSRSSSPAQKADAGSDVAKQQMAETV
ncbi:MAG: class I SAM-dependent methyltransferase [Isosphaeraceae bacterium]